MEVRHEEALCGTTICSAKQHKSFPASLKIHTFNVASEHPTTLELLELIVVHHGRLSQGRIQLDKEVVRMFKLLLLFDVALTKIGGVPA